MFPFARWFLFIAILQIAVLACAQDGYRDISIGGRLHFQLPLDWIIVSQADEKEYVTGSPRGPGDATLILRCRPVDFASDAVLSVISDRTEALWESGPHWAPAVLRRLEEHVALSGFQPLATEIRSIRDGITEGGLVTVSAWAPERKNRTFACAAFRTPMKPALWLHWETDEGDAVTAESLGNWLASVKMGDSNVGYALQKIPAAEPETPPVVVASETAPDSIQTTVAPHTGPSARAGALVNEIRANLVLVAGTAGKGSGFVIQTADGPWLVTNLHVLADNPNPVFTTLTGVTIPMNASFAAVAHDICRIQQPSVANALELMPNIDAEVRVGDDVVVPGNAEGAGVVKPWEGKVVGLGPNLVEVDAPFIPGNSGSPIIHAKTGKVIGVATYLTIKKLDDRAANGSSANPEGASVEERAQNFRHTEIRRFGYRLDSVKTWEPINWRRFNSQAAQVAKIEATSRDFVQLFDDSRRRKVDAKNYATPGIRRALESYEERRKIGGNMSSADADRTRRYLMGDLRSATRNDIAAFDSFNAYDYFRRVVASEATFRDELYESFSRQMW